MPGPAAPMFETAIGPSILHNLGSGDAALYDQRTQLFGLVTKTAGLLEFAIPSAIRLIFDFREIILQKTGGRPIQKIGCLLMSHVASMLHRNKNVAQAAIEVDQHSPSDHQDEAQAVAEGAHKRRAFSCARVLTAG